MPRTIESAEITRKTHRLRLPPGRKIHWREVGPGVHVGYRRPDSEVAGTWIARERQEDGTYRQRSIGRADDFGAGLSYDDAAAAAVEAAKTQVLKQPDVTLHAAADDYLAAKYQTLSNDRSRQQVRWVVGKIKSSFPDCALHKTSVRMVSDFHLSFVKPSSDERKARASRATADRMLAALNAILNRAVAMHGLKIERAWAAVKPFGSKRAGNARQNRLSPEQVRAFLDAAEPDLRDFLFLAAETGARPGELYSARVRDYDAGHLTLSGKTGTRTVPLTKAADVLIRQLVAGAEPTRFLLMRSNGLPWRGSTGDLSKKIKVAVAKAKLPADVCAYDLRHTWISTALERGAPTALVAQRAGTSIAMIEKNYAKFVPGSDAGFFGGIC